MPREWYPCGTLGVPKRAATNMSINMEAEMLWEPAQSKILIFLLSLFLHPQLCPLRSLSQGELRLLGEREDGRLLVSFHRAYV